MANENIFQGKKQAQNKKIKHKNWNMKIDYSYYINLVKLNLNLLKKKKDLKILI